MSGESWVQIQVFLIPKQTLLHKHPTIALSTQLFMLLNLLIFNIISSGHYNSVFQLSYIIMSFVLFFPHRIVIFPPVGKLFLAYNEITSIILAIFCILSILY